MNHHQLRQKYPKFIYESFSHRIKNGQLICEFKYSIPPDHTFTHTVSFETLSTPPGWTKVETPRGWPNGLPRGGVLDNLIFHLGLAEIFSYWKLTSSPIVEIAAGHLAPDQIKFWHKLFINGMGQYFYENRIDFTGNDFITISSSNTSPLHPSPGRRHELSENLGEGTRERGTSEVLVPLGGGKDSIVTAELLKNHFPIRPIIVHPTTPASLRISNLLGHQDPIFVHRKLDPKMLELTNQGYLTGHIPYSAILAFIFLLAAATENIPYVAVSNETSSNEGNVEYLGSTINHQYSKTLEFEQDFNSYLKHLGSNISYFSFLRPLHEFQIAKLFSKMPNYFKDFRSCNKNQQADSWCGQCPKCLSVALSLIPWIGEAKVVEIMGVNPLTDPTNHELLAQMTDPSQAKPFECIVTTEEAQICLEFIQQGQTARVREFLHRLGPSTMPPKFAKILKNAYTEGAYANS